VRYFHSLDTEFLNDPLARSYSSIVANGERKIKELLSFLGIWPSRSTMYGSPKNAYGWEHGTELPQLLSLSDRLV
jgi:hypothetical protein